MTLFSKLLKKMWKELKVGTVVQICESFGSSVGSEGIFVKAANPWSIRQGSTF